MFEMIETDGPLNEGNCNQKVTQSSFKSYEIWVPSVANGRRLLAAFVVSLVSAAVGIIGGFNDITHSRFYLPLGVIGTFAIALLFFVIRFFSVKEIIELHRDRVTIEG